MSTGRDALNPEDFARAQEESGRLLELARWAALSPSAHNSQPWLFAIDGLALEIWADRTRALPVVDPDDRELLISCGAALHHAEAAARGLGMEPTVTVLPEADRPDLIGRLVLEGRREPTGPDRARLSAMLERRTHRQPFDREPVATLLEGVVRRQEVDGLWAAVVTDESTKVACADLVARADMIQMADRRFRRELAAWVHPNRSRSRDGIPGFAVGVDSDFASLSGPLVVRLFDAGNGQAQRDRSLAEGSPALLIVGADSDTEEAWLKTGRFLSAVLLDAWSSGVAASYLNQPIELPELRPDVAALVGRGGFPNLILRLGKLPAGMAETRLTPRRPLSQLLRPHTQAP